MASRPSFLYLKNRFKHPFLLLLALVALCLKVVSFFPAGVEQRYANGIYPHLATGLRVLLGPVPFSVGDVLYLVAGCYFLYLIYKGAAALWSKGFSGVLLARGFVRCLEIGLVVYIWFNALWGLNYNRLGIAHQLELELQPYTLKEVTDLTSDLQRQLNFYAAQADTAQNWSDGKTLQHAAAATYQNAKAHYPYLTYRQPTIKPSLYTHVGHYFGFTGYYNPFTGEAQLKTTIPSFVKPFVVLHEVAHQLGYAKENEANFVAFLAGKHAGDAAVLYSVYYELYRYALREVAYRDTTVAAAFRATLHPRVLRDNEVLKAYVRSTQNNIEPLMTLFYDRFLKANDQAEGVRSYNRVVALLVAYRNKFGAPAI